MSTRKSQSVGAALIAGALAGCGYVASHEELGTGRYRVEMPYGSKGDYGAMVTALDQRATRLCDGEYYKAKDYDLTHSGPRRLVWEVSCKHVPQAFRNIKRPSVSDGL